MPNSIVPSVTTGTSAFMLELVPGHNYRVAVTAVNKAGAGPPAVTTGLLDQGESSEDSSEGYRTTPSSYRPDQGINLVRPANLREIAPTGTRNGVEVA